MLRNVQTFELFTILIVVGIVFIAFAKLLFYKRFNDFVYVIWNSKYLKIYAKDHKFLDKFDAILFVNLILSLSIFGFICLQLVKHVFEPTIENMLKLILNIGCFLLVKILFERLIGNLFEIDKLMNQYLFQKMSYKNFIGLILVPVNLILLFSITPSLIIIYVIVYLVLAVNFIGLATFLKAHQNKIKQNWFYFILYLCTLEIAPYIILYKVLNSY